ncbi:predicted protein [Nematostella vectensis]|uniref:Uncharacterized protein n=1 Tax=Nematostella vectensis TaxID=45351 RepID=A7S2V9_NEMVE|nr:predicted protein [Nematostella vectensis]|eukprot:XP_001634058.1 predicted protein [Nematostella vectensis]
MGYDIERFVGAVNEGLLCCICRDVLEEPLMAPCEHSYCSACVLGWLTHYNTCPEDRQSLWPSDLKPIFRYMKNDLDSLKIHCDHQSKGCKSVVRLGSLARHLKEECDFVAVACPNTGCNESLNRCDLDTHLIICDFQTAKCTRGCGLQVNMNELAQHNCINELRGSMEKQKSDFQTELRDMKRDMEDKLDAQRVEMVYKESTLQNQIEELKVQVSELVRETRLLKARETQRWSLSKAEQAEYRDIMEWLKGLKYQDDITEKYCGTCNKRFLHIRKEPLTSLREQVGMGYAQGS